MIGSLLRNIRVNRFFARVLTLSGGTAIGMGLLLLSSPILTRLYTPEEFGLFAIFASFSAMLTVIANLRWEFAIPVLREEEKAAATVGIATIIAILISASTALLVWLGGEHIARMVEAPALASLLWILPVTVLIFGLGSPLSYWSVRQGAFRSNAVNRIIYFGTQAFGQLGFGLLGLGGAGLIIGYTLGYAARFLHFLRVLPDADRSQLIDIDSSRLWQVAIEHWRYPAYYASSSILQSGCQMLPAVLVGMLYGPAMAGWYGLSQRIVGLPVRVLSEAASQVFMNEIKGLDGKKLNRLFLRTAAIFLMLGMLILMPVVIAGPFLFAFVFGEPWRQAGEIVQLLVPLYLARFVVMPISQTLNAVGRLDLHLVSSLLAVVALASSFAIGWWWQLEASWTIGLFSITSTLAFLFYLGASWVMVQRNLKNNHEFS